MRQFRPLIPLSTDLQTEVRYHIILLERTINLNRDLALHHVINSYNRLPLYNFKAFHPIVIHEEISVR